MGAQQLLRAAALCIASLAGIANGALDFESVQLQDKDVSAFSAEEFAKGDPPPQSSDKLPLCKAWPGNADWPSAVEWRRFNASLDGALLQPDPPGEVCYQGPDYNAAKCAYLVNNASSNHYYIDDPINVLTQWPEGNTCLPGLNVVGNCTRGGFPYYVVNATTVKHVQATINFARNNNIRLIIKNTGHDFGGRSVGAGSISIWTHHLNAFKFLPSYKRGNYYGPAAHFGSGLEQYELFNQMFLNNVTMVGAGFRTIGANGGWFASGGHGNLASLYGLGADQALEIHAVTADGRYVVANEDQNSDLFFAFRGGGPSTYGVVTSVIVKAYPPITTVQSYLSIACNPPPDTNARATLAPLSNVTNYVNDTSRFWDALQIYFKYKQTIVDAHGVDWDYLYPLGNNRTSYSFRVRTTFPNVTTTQAIALLQPLYTQFAAHGFNFTLNTEEMVPQPYAGTSVTNPATLSSLGLTQTRYRSRLLPRKNWASDTVFNQTFAAIRNSVENGQYTLHGLGYGPSNEVAGYPGRTGAVNPAWREAVLHIALVTSQPIGLTAAQARDEESRIQGYFQAWKDVSPGAGAYMNEGDPGEANWQQSFYGSHYPKLAAIKKKRDPWGVFWATTTPGSEAWEVKSVDGYPHSQNGRLCRTGVKRI
ncbi:hypothetical protein B0H66DRAFT_535273 [Apodospora peruviana]|uniref:FAD-binding PCMH-type domain-containing protein n=1 Tax=Apodospora peruviana TaxID=516989 RepID=A0AAE0I208_9PEZI|nr:hypothetical protein B0H66DRAFT_535273 [Apodospora peruviana]